MVSGVFGADYSWSLFQIIAIIVTAFSAGFFTSFAFKGRPSASSEGRKIPLSQPAQIVIGIGLLGVGLIFLWQSMSPYNTCVRGLLNDGVVERIAFVKCMNT